MKENNQLWKLSWSFAALMLFQQAVKTPCFSYVSSEEDRAAALIIIMYSKQ